MTDHLGAEVQALVNGRLAEAYEQGRRETLATLRTLAGEPEHVIDPDLHGQPITASTAMHLLDRAADVIEHLGKP